MVAIGHIAATNLDPANDAVRHSGIIVIRDSQTAIVNRLADTNDINGGRAARDFHLGLPADRE